MQCKPRQNKEQGGNTKDPTGIAEEPTNGAQKRRIRRAGESYVVLFLSVDGVHIHESKHLDDVSDPGQPPCPVGEAGAAAGKPLLPSSPNHNRLSNMMQYYMLNSIKNVTPTEPSHDGEGRHKRASVNISPSAPDNSPPLQQHGGGRSSHQTSAWPIENEETAKRYSPLNTPTAEPKACIPHMLGNNSIPRRKSGKRPAACSLRKAPSCPAGWEILQADRHRPERRQGTETHSVLGEGQYPSSHRQPAIQPRSPRGQHPGKKGPPTSHCQRNNSQRQKWRPPNSKPRGLQGSVKEQQSSKPGRDDIPKSSSCWKTEKRTGGMLGEYSLCTTRGRGWGGDIPAFLMFFFSVMEIVISN
ncbi:hypothetical protein NDU88_001095 [Pleurodeles waltl]|uniref:Uncharacterized protein n=1 Tax=Pleurodeles waltl TaxID=8319 RepID=A0AAV7WLM3_PLEWA|nr:hypothetical protein NDU88_001095 [Pleurodeles waltl]